LLLRTELVVCAASQPDQDGRAPCSPRCYANHDSSKSHTNPAVMNSVRMWQCNRRTKMERRVPWQGKDPPLQCRGGIQLGARRAFEWLPRLKSGRSHAEYTNPTSSPSLPVKVVQVHPQFLSNQQQLTRTFPPLSLKNPWTWETSCGVLADGLWQSIFASSRCWIR